MVRKEKVAETQAPAASPLDLLLNIPVSGSVLLAEKTMSLQEILSFRPGDIIEFDKSLNHLLEFEIMGRRFASGKAMSVGEKFGLQVVEIRDPRETVRAMGS